MRVQIIFISNSSDTCRLFIISFPLPYFCLYFYPWVLWLDLQFGGSLAESYYPSSEVLIINQSPFSFSKVHPHLILNLGGNYLFGVQNRYMTLFQFSPTLIYSCHKRMKICDRLWAKLMRSLKMEIWGSSWICSFYFVLGF